MDPISIYVPDHADVLAGLTIDPGSGIVGSPFNAWNEHAELLTNDPDEVLVIDFEGNRHGASNMVTFADRVRHAHGRHVEHYPTIARLMVKAEAMTAVGQFHPDEGRVQVENDDQLALLARWLGVAKSDPDFYSRLNREMRVSA